MTFGREMTATPPGHAVGVTGPTTPVQAASVDTRGPRPCDCYRRRVARWLLGMTPRIDTTPCRHEPGGAAPPDEAQP